MSTVANVSARRTSALARAADYIELTKPKIGALVLVAVAVAYYVASWGQPAPLVLLHLLLGTLLVSASASALNQWLERETDALMERTAGRPLPARRLTSAQVLSFAALTICGGFAYLAVAVNLRTALLGALTWFLYVWVYTPLKSRTAANTVVGAIAGALPVLMGWSAGGAALDGRAWALFLILFLWQFPHFMAIAWIYRRQYARGGLKMLTVVDPSGRRAGLHAVAAALALLPVSFVPALFVPHVSWYVALAFLLGAGQLACALVFFARLDEVSARRLLRASLVYLPALLALLILVPWL
jgi:protoheme IX farnesyltransferase